MADKLHPKVPMRRTFQASRRTRAQTLVFFILAFGAIFLLCGLAIDSGMLYLAKARLSRAVDGAALAAVGNFHQSDVPATNRSLVATTMRNFAVANYTDLYPNEGPPGLDQISTTATEVPGTYPLPNGETASIYTFTFHDGTGTDSTGNYRKYVQVILKTGAGGQITSATCNARCPAHTYFMGYAGAFFRDMKVSSSAIATRNPRLIMVVIDRSGSMLGYTPTIGGAYGLPDAVVTFLNFFDTSADYIGIVSFSGNARLEMPLTTNFLIAGTNVLYNAYDPINHVPGVDPEQGTANYDTSGVRRMKFGGSTSADEGIRLGLEQMMANSGFNNPDVTKYLVLFTDGAWNNVRTLLAAPGYTNIISVPQAGTGTNFDVTSLPVPTLSPYAKYTNAIVADQFDPNDHTNDVWQSQDGEYEPISPPNTLAFLEGAPILVSTNSFLGTNSSGSNVYATNLNVWLQPGSVDYVYDASGNQIGNPYVSCYTNSTLTANIVVPPGGTNVLVVPGYIVDGTFCDSLDMPYPDNGNNIDYRLNNYEEPYMWPDDPGSPTTVDSTNTSLNISGANSNMRKLMFRNYVNMLTGFYIYRADDPTSTPATPEPLDDVSTYFRPLYGLGPYYPGPGFYWPFGDMFESALALGPVGVTPDPTLQLINPLNNPSTDPANYPARHLSYSINMLSTNAAPNWAGELFYRGTNGPSAISGTSTTSVSAQITSGAEWQIGAPSWLAAFPSSGIHANTTFEATHYPGIINGQVWRPTTFIGNPLPGGLSSVTPSGSVTGGYVTDGAGNYFRDSMAYSGRPTHFYDFSQSTWVPIRHNHVFPPNEALPLGTWKAQEYAWHARALGVTIYTVGYGSAVDDPECLLLAQVANATNVITTTFATNAIPFNGNQPVGQEFYATDTNQILSDFQSIAQAINAALTQ